MALSGLELVGIGQDRLLGIATALELLEAAMDGVGILTVEDAKEFSDMVHRARTARKTSGAASFIRRGPQRQARPRIEDK